MDQERKKFAEIGKEHFVLNLCILLQWSPYFSLDSCCNLIDVFEPAIEEKDGDIAIHAERKKVQWTDACGSELDEIKEFKPRICRALML